MVDSVVDLMSSSISWIQMPNFEVFAARIASALNKIIHYSHFKKKDQSGGTEDTEAGPFPSGKTDCLPDPRAPRVTGDNDCVENYADLFTVRLRNCDSQDFDSKWDGIPLSMTKIPPEDILEGLYKLRIRQPEKVKTVLELYYLEIHQEKAGPDYHRLKMMVKRSIEQDTRNKNFGARSGNYEKNALVKNQGTKKRGPRILGDCCQWGPTGSVLEETIAVSVMIPICVEKWHSRIRLQFLACSIMREMRREPEVPEETVPVVECFDDHARITSKDRQFILKNMAPFSMLVLLDQEWLQIWEKCSYTHRQVDEQPSGWSVKCGDECSSHVEEEWFARKCMTTCCQPWQKSRAIGATRCQVWDLSWVERRTCWASIIERTTIGLCSSGHEPAEVYLTEELRHAETNLTSEIHEKVCTSH